MTRVLAIDLGGTNLRAAGRYRRYRALGDAEPRTGAGKPRCLRRPHPRTVQPRPGRWRHWALLCRGSSKARSAAGFPTCLFSTASTSRPCFRSCASPLAMMRRLPCWRRRARAARKACPTRSCWPSAPASVPRCSPMVASLPARMAAPARSAGPAPTSRIRARSAAAGWNVSPRDERSMPWRASSGWLMALD